MEDLIGDWLDFYAYCIFNCDQNWMSARKQRNYKFI